MTRKPNSLAGKTDRSSLRSERTDQLLIQVTGFGGTRAESSRSWDKFRDARTFSGLGLSRDIPFNDGACWDWSNRSDARKLHAFLFPRAWLGIDRQAGSEAFEYLLSDWQNRFAGKNGSNQVPELAFHDETTAQRLLSCVIFVHWGQPSHSGLQMLQDRMGEDVHLLLDEDFYAGLNNHGMYQDLALLAFALSGAADVGTSFAEITNVAAERLLNCLEFSFTEEGVHVEHSPSYHLLVARLLELGIELVEELTSQGIGDVAVDRNILQRIAKSKDYAVHLVAPNGHYPRIADTAGMSANTKANRDFFGPEFEYAITGGEAGTKPAETTRIFEQSGYAVARSAWGDAKATYILFCNAYNSAYHKHSDENSFIVYHNGRELFTEAGPNGYQYTDKKTKYAYSSGAHNSLLIDRRGLPRNDGRISDTYLLDNGSTATELDVEGVTLRYPEVIWRRQFKTETDGEAQERLIRITDRFLPEDFAYFTARFSLLDGLVGGGSSRSDRERDEPELDEPTANYQLFFHLGPEMSASVDDKSVVEIACEGKKWATMQFAGNKDFSVQVISPEVRNRPENIYLIQPGKPTRLTTVAVSFDKTASEMVQLESTVVIEMQVCEER